MRRRLSLFLMILIIQAQAFAQLTSDDIADLKTIGQEKGWTFEVGQTSATERSPSELYGLVIPENWTGKANFSSFPMKADLPGSFDWLSECTPVRDQASCGSCWAFSMIGVVESAISIVDGLKVDLSEQWIMSCNTETEPPVILSKGLWGCEGGWFMYDYFQDKPDECDGFGAVMESSFQYQAADVPCNCPYPHQFWIDSWAFVGEEEGLPEVDAIKQAIMTYGPVSAAVYVNIAFFAYDGGVFNAHEGNEVNHGIVLVGWDDSLGTKGAWIMKNSWGENWGKNGYMYIEYGCSNVGFGACYVDYPGKGIDIGPTITKQPAGWFVEEGESFSLKIEAEGISDLHYQWYQGDDPVGTDSNVYTVEYAAIEDIHEYSCRVSDIRGSTISYIAVMEVLDTGEIPVVSFVVLTILSVIIAIWGFRLVRCEFNIQHK